MAPAHSEGLTARLDGEFVVFLIGIRLNRFSRIHHWWSARRRLKKLLAELEADPQSGMLGYQQWGFEPALWVMYWRSFAHLEKWARLPKASHREAWTDFGRRLAAPGGVGIWHETYLVRSGTYETVYNNMPPTGLGRIGTLAPATGKWATARNRLGQPRKTANENE